MCKSWYQEANRFWYVAKNRRTRQLAMIEITMKIRVMARLSESLTLNPNSGRIA